MSAFSLRLPGLPKEFQGLEPKRTRYKLQPDEPYPPKPDWFVNSLGEWVVWFHLTQNRERNGYGQNLIPVGPNQPPVRGKTFFYQTRIPNLGEFQSEVSRIDFLLPGFGGAGYEALALDPYNEIVHGGFSGEGFAAGVDLDMFKRQSFAVQANVQLIWLHSSRLDAGDFAVIESALAGRDESPRALLGI